jgi:CopG family transcriptional regulator, nickel-responsive regulator
MGLSVAVMHLHLTERCCLEVSILKGERSSVERFANHLIGQPGVRYGRLVVLSATENLDD